MVEQLEQLAKEEKLPLWHDDPLEVLLVVTPTIGSATALGSGLAVFAASPALFYLYVGVSAVSFACYG